MSSGPVDLHVLRRHAETVRAAIEAVPLVERPNGMGRFPIGAGGDSSLLLGAYLTDRGIPGFEYIRGRRGDLGSGKCPTHAWLRRGACVVDMTAGQFDDAPEALIVAEPSPWHSTFETEEPDPADFRVWANPPMLHFMYGLVLDYIEGNA